MSPVADLLDLWPSDRDVASRLNEEAETISGWRSAGSVPEQKALELVDLALSQGHAEEVARIAAETSPFVWKAAMRLQEFEVWARGLREAARPDARADPAGGDEPEAHEGSITQILEEMQQHRAFSGDAVARVRALRAEWDRRGELQDGIRAGDRA